MYKTSIHKSGHVYLKLQLEIYRVAMWIRYFQLLPDIIRYSHIIHILPKFMSFRVARVYENI